MQASGNEFACWGWKDFSSQWDHALKVFRAAITPTTIATYGILMKGVNSPKCYLSAIKSIFTNWIPAGKHLAHMSLKDPGG